MTAIDFTARGLASQALATRNTRLFGEASQCDIPDGVDLFSTSGHGKPGLGAAQYVHDALCDAALLAAHPACAFQSADGRIFRLLPANGVISVEQCGAEGDPAGTNLVNDQPAIQAALDYAAATGIGEVLFEQRAYSIWATERTSPMDQIYERDGHPLTITATVSLRSACGDSYLNFRGRDGSSMEDDWYLVKTTAADAVPNAVWRGGGLFVLGDFGALPTPLSIEKLTIDHVHLIGGRSRTGNHGAMSITTGDGWDITDKGFWLQDSAVGRIELIGVEIAGFKGELYFVGGTGVEEELLVDCHFHTTNADALNSGSLGRSSARNCRFGNAYQAAETIGGAFQTYSQCVFYDSIALSMWGGPTPGFTAGQPYNHASRDPALPVPFIHFDGCIFDRVTNAYLGSWTRGQITTIDSQILIGIYGQQKTTDIDLQIVAWLDQASGLQVVGIDGPPDLVTQVPGAPAGTFFEPPQRIRIHVASAKRTEAGLAGNARWDGVFGLSGLLDKDTIFLSADECEAKNYVRPNALLDLPLVAQALRFTPTDYGQPDGGSYSAPAPASTETINPAGTAHTFYPGTAGITEIAIGNTYAYVHGQRLRLWHGGGGVGDRIIRLSPGNAGLDLPLAVELKNAGDHVELQWNAHGGTWQRASGTLPVGSVTGQIDLADLPDLPASKVTSGQFDPARIPALDAAKIASGTIDTARLPAPDWSTIANKPAFAAVATSGSYDDLSDVPALGLLAGAILSDPDADRIPFWDDSSGAIAWLGLGSGLSISGTTLSASAGGGSSSGWTQIATAAPAGVGTVDFTSIPQTYDELHFEVVGLSHNNGSNTTLSVHVSHDGAAWGTGLTLTSGPATDNYYGGGRIVRYTSGSGVMVLGMNNVASSPAITAGGAARGWRCDGGITALRIILGAGNFDAGTITLYGR